MTRKGDGLNGSSTLGLMSCMEGLRITLRDMSNGSGWASEVEAPSLDVVMAMAGAALGALGTRDNFLIIEECVDATDVGRGSRWGAMRWFDSLDTDRW